MAEVRAYIESLYIRRYIRIPTSTKKYMFTMRYRELKRKEGALKVFRLLPHFRLGLNLLSSYIIFNKDR